MRHVITQQTIAVHPDFCTDPVPVTHRSFQHDFDPSVDIGDRLQNLGILAYDVIDQIRKSVLIEVACYSRKR